jgi:hypothetical protein
LKFITDYGVDVYAYIIEVYDILGLPPLPPSNITRLGVGFYGLFEDMIALLPLYDLKTLFDVKMETREYFKKVVTTIHSHLFLVSIHCVYLNFDGCCLCYAHTCVNSCDECITPSHRT